MSVEQHEGFTAGQAARVLARAEAGWGRATYGLALGHLCKSYESRATDPEESDADRADAQEKAERAARVRTWITDLVASVPIAGDEGTVPLQTVVSGVLDFLERRTARSNALDHRAAAALQEHIGELRALGAFSCALPEALRFVRERVQSLTVAPERPRPGHLYASHLSQAGYAGRPFVFFVGLEEGRVFSSSTEDAVLLDAERAAISADLRLSTDRIDEAVYAVLSRLAVSGPTVDLQLFLSRYSRVPGNICVVVDAAGVSAPAGQRDIGLSGDEVGARRAEIGRADRPRGCALAQRLVAPRSASAPDRTG